MPVTEVCLGLFTRRTPTRAERGAMPSLPMRHPGTRRCAESGKTEIAPA